MCDDSLDRCSQRRDLGVAFVVGFAELSAWWFFPGSRIDMSLVAFIADRAAGVSDDVRDGRVGEGLRVMSLARQGIRKVDRGAIEQAQQLGVEPCGAVLAASQFWVVTVGPAGGEGPVEQARTAVEHVDGLRR